MWLKAQCLGFLKITSNQQSQATNFPVLNVENIKQRMFSFYLKLSFKR